MIGDTLVECHHADQGFRNAPLPVPGVRENMSQEEWKEAVLADPRIGPASARAGSAEDHHCSEQAGEYRHLRTTHHFPPFLSGIPFMQLQESFGNKKNPRPKGLGLQKVKLRPNTN